MYISIDIGGTNIRIARAKRLQKNLFRDLASFRIKNDYKKDLEAIKEILNQFKKIDSIAIGLPGLMNKEKTLLTNVANLKSWEKKPIKKDMEQSFGCPVLLENDTNLAALGEAVFGDMKGKSFVFIIWGTGIGGAEIINTNGNIIQYPFEPTFLLLDKDLNFGLACSGSTLTKKFGKDLSKIKEKDWQKIIALFAQGIINVIYVRPTPLIILGGGVILNQRKKIKDIEKLVGKSLKIYSTPRIKISKLGDNAGLYGGFALLKIQLDVTKR